VRSPLGTLLRAAARGYLRAEQGLHRVEEGVHRAATGLLAEALSPDELNQVSLGRAAARARLAPWEEAWLARRLPPPPARVLVGGAGHGVEAAYLASAGYRVDALEPAAAAARACAAHAEEVWTARFEDLSRVVLDGAAGPLAGRRYDAVLLGWGSLSHVLDARERQRLFAAVARLAPAGPILASFILVTDETAPGRADRLGRRAGRALARLRRLPSPRDDGALLLGHWFGFIHQFTVDEIEALARACGRTVVWEHDDETLYPHITLIAA
jgi:hypothetical protein